MLRGGGVEIEFFDRDSLSFYQGKGGICIMQGWFAQTTSFLPINSKILSVFVGTHFAKQAQNFLKYLVVRCPYYFSNKEIGCRDKYTLEFCQKMGLEAYFSRCLTLTLPKRTLNANQNKVFLVNIEDRLKKFLPQDIKQNAIEIKQKYIEVSEHFIQDYWFKMSEALLNRYKNEAKLIITTALHCAAPCTAMGIPVVLIMDDYEEQKTRFGALEGILPFYTLEDLKQNKIDFNPKSLDIEALKENMLLNLKLSIAKAKGEVVDENELQNLREKIAHFDILGKNT